MQQLVKNANDENLNNVDDLYTIFDILNENYFNDSIHETYIYWSNDTALMGELIKNF